MAPPTDALSPFLENVQFFALILLPSTCAWHDSNIIFGFRLLDHMQRLTDIDMQIAHCNDVTENFSALKIKKVFLDDRGNYMGAPMGFYQYSYQSCKQEVVHICSTFLIIVLKILGGNGICIIMEDMSLQYSCSIKRM